MTSGQRVQASQRTGGDLSVVRTKRTGENPRAVQMQRTSENPMAIRAQQTGTNPRAKVYALTCRFSLELWDGQGVPEPTRTRK